MLLDSNIIIYSARPENEYLRRFIAEHDTVVSALSYLEVLGYHRLGDNERFYLEEFFRSATMLAISNAILEQAVILRQHRRMNLGDAIIGATAIVHNLTLVTRNIEDFQWIPQIILLNPFDN